MLPMLVLLLTTQTYVADVVTAADNMHKCVIMLLNLLLGTNAALKARATELAKKTSLVDVTAIYSC